jgi:predicted CXXCH cytochrome family protein
MILGGFLFKNFRYLGFAFLGVVAASLSYCGGNGATHTSTSDSLYFWNLHDTVSYVGMQECKGCHQDIHQHFIHTGMGQSFDKASPEKSKGTFPFMHMPSRERRSPEIFDAKTGYSFQAFWRNDSLFIRQFLRETSSSKAISFEREEHIPYIIGSGQHTNSHFWTDGSYVYQAPLTFYTQKGLWDLPPGYENNNVGFHRKIDMECMSCHNAMPQVRKEAKNFFDQVPLGIDCERCHGPGELHVQLKKQGIIVDTSKYADRSIVNPKRLPYRLQVDICQRCHLQGNNVLKEGKHFEDFRPGMSLTQIFDIYMPKYENEDYFVMAGHADRFQKSACFIGSNKGKTETYNAQLNFTCINCHNPHVSVKETKISQFNATCTGCHQQNSTRSVLKECALDIKKREHPTGCVGCHMQASGTEDIPHVMVHDHKIQRPRIRFSDLESQKGKLLGLYAVNNQNPAPKDEIRAYLNYFEKFDPQPIYLKKAANLLKNNPNEIASRIHHAYLEHRYRDIIVLAAKIKSPADAWTHYRIAKSHDQVGSLKEALRWYEKAQELQTLDPDFVAEFANALIRDRQLTRAKTLLDAQLKRLQKHELTWLNRGSIFFLEGNKSQAKKCFEQVLRLDPKNKTAHLYLSELYESVGDMEKSRYHLSRS